MASLVPRCLLEVSEDGLMLFLEKSPPPFVLGPIFLSGQTFSDSFIKLFGGVLFALPFYFLGFDDPIFVFKVIAASIYFNVIMVCDLKEVCHNTGKNRLKDPPTGKKIIDWA